MLHWINEQTGINSLANILECGDLGWNAYGPKEWETAVDSVLNPWKRCMDCCGGRVWMTSNWLKKFFKRSSLQYQAINHFRECCIAINLVAMHSSTSGIFAVKMHLCILRMFCVRETEIKHSSGLLPTLFSVSELVMLSKYLPIWFNIHHIEWYCLHCDCDLHCLHSQSMSRGEKINTLIPDKLVHGLISQILYYRRGSALMSRALVEY